MKNRPFLDRVKTDLVLPRSNEALWALIRTLDAEGPWTATDVCKRTLINPGTPRRLIKRLLRGGYAEQIGTRTTKGKNPQEAPLYRLLKSPVEWPRLAADGSSRPEPRMETMWRSMKMAKTFTARELMAMADRDGLPIPLGTARGYLDKLARVGIVVRVSNKGRSGPAAAGRRPNRETRYRLVKNLGALAPKILSTKVVFDPNARVVLERPQP